MEYYEKDPDETLDYKVDWDEFLADSDTISTSTFILDTGITEESTSNTDDTATIFISGGTVGTSYKVTNRIVTAGGRTADRSFYISVVTDVE